MKSRAMLGLKVDHSELLTVFLQNSAFSLLCYWFYSAKLITIKST